MPKPTAKYRSPLESESSLVEQALALHAWVRAHTRGLIVAAVGIGFLVAAALYYLNYQRDLEASAAVELEKARTTVLSGNTSLAIADLQRFLAQYGSARRAREARVMLATLLIQASRPREALDVLGTLWEKPGADPVAARAALVAGAAREGAGDTAGAIQGYLRAAEELQLGFQKREALAGAARLQTLRGDHRGAADTYRKLLALVPDESVERPLYEMRRAEAQARARAREAAQGNGPVTR